MKVHCRERHHQGQSHALKDWDQNHYYNKPGTSRKVCETFPFKSSVLDTVASTWFAATVMCFVCMCSFGCTLQCANTVSNSCVLLCVCLHSQQQVIPEGLLTFVWVQQHSIKLVKYAQGYLSQPERLWTYMSPSNRCTDYGLKLAPEEWLKQPVSLAQTRPSNNSTSILKWSGARQHSNILSAIYISFFSMSSKGLFLTLQQNIITTKLNWLLNCLSICYVFYFVKLNVDTNHWPRIFKHRYTWAKQKELLTDNTIGVNNFHQNNNVP